MDVVTHQMPCSLQTALIRCNHLHLIHSKNARKSRHLSCKATSDRSAADRRSVLLGGTAAAAVAAGLATQRSDSALADPIQLADLRSCRPIEHDTDILPNTDCCPPYWLAGKEVIDFQLPPDTSPLRVRKAAHRLVGNEEYLAKYEEALRLMRQLPDSDPRSFLQQWRVHCAYCEGAYPQAGHQDPEIQIHGCWLFFPWHRLYLYFYERILGKLIGDDSFALPYWNWDDPEGMTLPQIYNDGGRHLQLYNENRNPMYQGANKLVDLDYGLPDDTGETHDHRIQKNLKIMYRQMISGAKTKQLFFGQPYRQGDMPNPGSGTIEFQPHNIVHNWTGTDPNSPSCGKDMGILGTAARDPLFFAHHGNIDRLWNIWNRISPRNTDFDDDDWRDASFLFYDEHARLVRARVRDCLDTSALRYIYDDDHKKVHPWSETKPLKKPGPPAPPDCTLPATLDKTVRVTVNRPKPMRTDSEKEEKEEVLVIDLIEIADHSKVHVKFDVFVNAPEGVTDTAVAQCAGSVALTPHAIGCPLKTVARFGISELLNVIGANDEPTVTVSIVPAPRNDKVKVGGVYIEYMEI